MTIIKKPCDHNWVKVAPGVLKCNKCGVEKKTGQGSAQMSKESQRGDNKKEK